MLIVVCFVRFSFYWFIFVYIILYPFNRCFSFLFGFLKSL